MSRSLKLSILLNVCLATLAVWLVRYVRIAAANFEHIANTSARDGGASVPHPAMPPIAQPATERTAPERQKQFQWSQVESSDYRTYIANLRAIGCPKQTIRDIITADVDTLYASRRGQLQQEQAGRPDQLALQTQLQRLQTEEAGVLLALLGPSASTQVPAEASSPPAIGMAEARRSKLHSLWNDLPDSVPLVFQDPGPEMNLNPAQTEIINDIRTTFNDELKGIDPTSADYAQRYQEARRNADQRMSAQLGYSVWQEYQAQSRNQHAGAPVTP